MRRYPEFELSFCQYRLIELHTTKQTDGRSDTIACKPHKSETYNVFLETKHRASLTNIARVGLGVLFERAMDPEAMSSEVESVLKILFADVAVIRDFVAAHAQMEVLLMTLQIASTSKVLAVAKLASVFFLGFFPIRLG